MSQHLPDEILCRASLRGREHAWPVNDIPAVIEAARAANLVSLSGTLQFRLPEATCECYWIDVSPVREGDDELSWSEQVQRAADEALRQFEALKQRCDFLAEGQQNFTEYFNEVVSRGVNPAHHMCFVWSAVSEAEMLDLRALSTR